MKHLDFSDIPTDIIRILADYENIDDLLEEEEFSHYAYTLKKFRLNRKESIDYYNGNLDILKKMKNPKKQLYLNLSESNIVVAHNIIAHSVNFSYSKNLKDVSALGNIHTLILEGCENVTDVSSLGNVHELNLKHTIITDVSALRNVHTLNLSECTFIEDFSVLRNVHTLDLSFTNISDISELGNVYDLDLSFTDVEDVDVLRNVHTLNLTGTKVYDVSALRNVHTLNLSECENLVNVSKLTNVHTLILSDSYVSDSDIEILKQNIPNLII